MYTSLYYIYVYFHKKNFKSICKKIQIDIFLLLTSLLEIIGNLYMIDDFLLREIDKNFERRDNAFTIVFQLHHTM